MERTGDFLTIRYSLLAIRLSYCWITEGDADEDLVLHRGCLPLSPRSRGVRVDPRESAEPPLRSEQGRRPLSHVPRHVACRRGPRARDHGQRAPPDRYLRRPGGAAAAGDPGAPVENRAAAHPR